MLLRPDRSSLSQSSREVLSCLSSQLADRTSLETHAAVVELATGIHDDVDGAVAEMAGLRRQLWGELHAIGRSVAAAGTHPLTVWQETEISGTARYQELSNSMRVLARREPTMALHIHIGVPAAEDAIRLLNGLRRHIPLLIALSANSPFWQGRDSGFASSRTVIFQAFPRTGLPRRFASYADYVETLKAFIASGAVADPSFFWWDLRLQPALGTVEVRAMDAQSTVADVAPLVALVQSLARLELERDIPLLAPSAEVLAENRFLAARDGMDARLIDPSGQSLVPVREELESLVAECRPHALALGCSAALERVRRLAVATGADRQRHLASQGTLEQLVQSLAQRFLPTPHVGLERPTAPA